MSTLDPNYTQTLMGVVFVMLTLMMCSPPPAYMPAQGASTVVYPEAEPAFSVGPDNDTIGEGKISGFAANVLAGLAAGVILKLLGM